jgi:TP901 family phage tail tape measure protein
MNGLQYTINFTGNAAAAIAQVNGMLGQSAVTVTKTKTAFADCWKTIMAVNGVVDGLNSFRQTMQGLNTPGIALNKNMQELSAITNVSGEALKKIEIAARDSAKAFGTDAVQNVESYKILLSKLSPDIANNSEALKGMGNQVNILSKSMSGDTVAAVGVLTTAMNQYGVSMDDPIKATEQMAIMNNIMAAAAQAGSAELPQIGQALENSGMQAKAFNVTFSETNAAIQALDKSGKKGAEGGIALRNVMAIMGEGRFLPKPTIAALQSLGISVDAMGDKSKTFAERLEVLKPLLNDQAALTQVFGRENSTAAMALIQNTSAITAMDGAIQGTNSAVDQANVVMDSYEERMKRSKAQIDDWKISYFNVTASIQPFINLTLDAVTEIGKLGQGVTALSSVFNINTIAKMRNTIATTASNIASKAMLAAQMTAAIAMELFTGKINIASAATALWSNVLKAAMGPIGWIAIAVGAVVAAVSYWSSATSKQTAEQSLNSKVLQRANEITGEQIVKIQIAKKVIEDENTTLAQKKEAYNQLIAINPEFVKTLSLDEQGHLNGAAAIDIYIQKLQQKAKEEASYQIQVENEKRKNQLRKSVTDRLQKLGSNVDITQLLDEGSETAYKAAAKAVKDDESFIPGLDNSFDNFSKDLEEFRNLTKENETLQKESAKNFTSASTTATAPTNVPNVTTPTTGGVSTKGLGKVAGKAARETATGVSSGGGTRNIQSLTINKLVENLTIQTTNIQESKERLMTIVREALLTAVNDFNLSAN